MCGKPIPFALIYKEKIISQKHKILGSFYVENLDSIFITHTTNQVKDLILVFSVGIN